MPSSNMHLGEFSRKWGYTSNALESIQDLKRIQVSLHAKKEPFFKGCEVGMSIQATTTPR
jgi:hypothetical protein